jgi:hypothetical protein
MLPKGVIDPSDIQIYSRRLLITNDPTLVVIPANAGRVWLRIASRLANDTINPPDTFELCIPGPLASYITVEEINVYDATIELFYNVHGQIVFGPFSFKTTQGNPPTVGIHEGIYNPNNNT